MAVVVNEFGSVDIDGRLVVGAEERIVALSDGCVCCVVRDDLRASVLELLARRERFFRPLRFDRIVVETSGLAAPGPVVQTFLVDPGLAARTRVDGVIAVAHAGLLEAQLGRHPEVAAQLAGADLVLLNHADQAEDLAAVEGIARRAAPLARVRATTRADIDPALALSLGSFDPGRWALSEPARHSEGRGGVVLEAGAVDLARLKLFLQFVASRKTWEIWRIKGILRCEAQARPVVVHAVWQWLELGPGEGELPLRSTLVILGRDLDEAEIRRAWAATVGG